MITGPPPAVDLPGPVRFAPEAPGTSAFWSAAASALLAWLRADPSPAAVVVPRGVLVAPLQRAMHVLAVAAGRPWVPPPVRPVDPWLADLAPAATPDPLARALAMLQALELTRPEALAARAPAERLGYASGVLEVLDAFERIGAAGRLDDPAWIDRIGTVFGASGAAPRIAEDLAALASVARAASDCGSVLAPRAERLRRLAERWAHGRVRVAWVACQPPGADDAMALAEFARALPADRLLRLEPDWAAIGAQAPLLRGAWPECFGEPVQPLRERRQRWRASPLGPRPELLHAADREREAQLAAAWVHGRLAAAREAGEPPPSVAIVVLDRWLARRVRALLERARILIDDREGWLLSTTVAATAAMGWLDAVASDGYYDDLLGWLDSRYVRPPGGPRLRAWIDRAATARRYLRGWHGLLQPLADAQPPDGLPALVAHAAAQRRAQPLLAHLDALEQAMRWARAPRRLATDAAGRQLLGLLDGLRVAAQAPVHARALAFGEFRALLAMLLERHRFFGAVDSPVQMLAPGEAVARPFDAVIVLGAADGALPAPLAPLPLVNDPLRALLQLPTAATDAARQQRELALLLALPRQAALTCRTDPGDGTRPAPWVERLHAVLDDEPITGRADDPGRDRAVVARPARRPAVPLGGLPARLPVGALERLIACPYRFLAQDGWRLREPPEPIDVPGVRERGELVHEILLHFHRRAQHEGLAFEPDARVRLRALLESVTDAVGERELAAGGGALGELAEWRATLEGYLDWALEVAAHGWRWVAGEQDGALRVRWRDADGRDREVAIVGRLDRLDRGPLGLRVVDYKLGSLDRLRRIAREPDRAAQLALYAWIASEQGEVIDSGYLSLRRDRVAWVRLDGAAADVLATWREALPAQLARIDGGEPLAALGGECTHCASRGLCRRGHWT